MEWRSDGHEDRDGGLIRARAAAIFLFAFKFAAPNGDQRGALPLRFGLQLEKPHLGSQRRFEPEGVRTLIKITAEQGMLKEPLPQPSKYIDQSYLKQALAEAGKK
jgi:hypothetical protein